MLTIPASMAGLPGISVPAGLQQLLGPVDPDALDVTGTLSPVDLGMQLPLARLPGPGAGCWRRSRAAPASTVATGPAP